MIEGLSAIPHVTVYGAADASHRTATVSFDVGQRTVSEIGLRLDDEFDVLCRVGLHCAPAAHRSLGTFPQGTVRFAAGASTTLNDIHAAIAAVRQLVGS